MIIPPPAHCHRAGQFWSQNGEWFSKGSSGQNCVHGQTDGQTDGHMDMKLAYAQLHIHTNIMCKF